MFYFADKKSQNIAHPKCINMYRVSFLLLRWAFDSSYRHVKFSDHCKHFSMAYSCREIEITEKTPYNNANQRRIWENVFRKNVPLYNEERIYNSCKSYFSSVWPIRLSWIIAVPFTIAIQKNESTGVRQKWFPLGWR